MHNDIYKQLIAHLGGTIPAAKALGINQSTASNYQTGRHGMSALIAVRAECITHGQFKAVDLCPALKMEQAAL